MYVAYEQVCSEAKLQKDYFGESERVKSEIFYHKIQKILPMMSTAC